MVLYHELTACYAAGSLGGTLGRLYDSLGRLSRANCTGSREQPGESAACPRFHEPAKVAYLNQTLRLMTDAWHSYKTASRRFNNLDEAMTALKETSLGRIGLKENKAPYSRHSDYQLLAQALDNLKNSARLWY
jgi:hypothetical protein